MDVAPLPGYSQDYGILLASLQDSTREWRDELGEPDVDTITWQPYPNGYSIGGQLLHIGAAEVFWVEMFCLGRKHPEEMKSLMNADMDVDKGLWPTPPAEPIAYYYNTLDRIRARTLESVKAFAPSDTQKDHWIHQVTFRWVLSHVIQHDSYHGGQAVMLAELAKHLRGA
jgi:uncharacterized damage-inducible protein DinB